MELLKQYGSIEEAIEPYLAGQPPEPPPPSREPAKPPASSSKRSSSKRHSSRKSAQEDDAPSLPSGAFMSSPDIAPPALGEVSPDRAGSLAGMVGLAARGEINAPCMGAGTPGTFSFGMSGAPNGGPSAGQFSSVPGNFGSQQQQQQSWQQPQQSQQPWQQQQPQQPQQPQQSWQQQQQPQEQQQSWQQQQGHGTPSAAQFHTAPPGQASWQQPPQVPQSNTWQSPPSQGILNPFNPFAAQAAQQTSQPCAAPAPNQDTLQKLLALRARKQEILQKLQQQQQQPSLQGYGGPPASGGFGMNDGQQYGTLPGSQPMQSGYGHPQQCGAPPPPSSGPAAYASNGWGGAAPAPYPGSCAGMPYGCAAANGANAYYGQCAHNAY
ncbi:unnamed protein product [Polarella glacialis]|nr:unnamed protein product [Polarella glacialis]